MKSIVKIQITALLATLSSALTLHAGDEVGLVLSGGGARGIAHVGVIKALEENDIPIDYVAGTSMGSIVGSLYSCGWTPDEMISMMGSKDFLGWSSGVINPDNLTLVSLPDPTPEWVTASFGGSKRNNVVSEVLPKSLVNPTPMNIEFLKLFEPYTLACGGDFDRLFVPFRCVFSDVYRKRKVVCRKGSLGQSVRGSMSFPLVYRSIVVDSVVAFDGGIYDNFPVDVMHEDFNPGFIIGVSVSTPDKKPNVNNMYSELEDLIIQNNDYSLNPEWGVKIQVPVSQFGTLSFDKAMEIYEIGYRTGLQWVDSIKSRLKERRSLEEVTEKRRRYAASLPEVRFDSIATPGLDEKERDYLLAVFRQKDNASREGLSLEETYRAYYDAVSQGDVNEILPEANGNVLVLKSKLKSPWRLGAGGWLTTGVGSNIFGNIGYHSLNKHSLDANLSVWFGQSYFAAYLKGRIRLGAYSPSYITIDGLWSRKKFYDGLPFFFSSDNISAFISHSAFGRIGYEVGLERPSLAGIALSYGTDFGVRKAKAELEYLYNTLDERTFPKNGRKVQILLSGEHMDSERPEDDRTLMRAKLDALWTNYYSAGQSFNIGALVRGGVSLGKRFADSKVEYMTSTAFEPVEILDNCYLPQLRSNDYAALGIIPIWSPVSRLQFRGEAYAYTKLRDEDGWKSPFSKTQFIGRLSAVGTLPFASISLSVSYVTPLNGWNFAIALGWYVPVPKQ